MFFELAILHKRCLKFVGESCAKDRLKKVCRIVIMIIAISMPFWGKYERRNVNMKLKKLLASAVAAALAVTTMAVTSFTASAATPVADGNITVAIGVL